MLCRKKKRKKKKNIFGTIPKYFWGLVSNYTIFMALASASKIILGNRGKYFFGEPGIIFREQGSTDLPWGFFEATKHLD